MTVTAATGTRGTGTDASPDRNLRLAVQGRLPEPKTFAAWAEATPDDFVVGVKASRYVTHVKRLKDPDEPVARFALAAERAGLHPTRVPGAREVRLA